MFGENMKILSYLNSSYMSVTEISIIIVFANTIYPIKFYI